MKICFVVRSVFSKLTTYTTTHLAFEAHKAGHDVAYTSVNSFSLTEASQVRATVIIPDSSRDGSRSDYLSSLHSGQAERAEVILSEYDVIFLRYNPNEAEAEKDRARIPALEFGRVLKSQGVFVVNDPNGLSRATSKMYLSSFPPQIRARTLVTRSTTKIKDFIRSLRRPAIVKPLSGFGGQDVFFIPSLKETNINQIISTVSKNGYVMVQEYIPEVKKGDKRLLLLNGSPIVIGKRVAIYKRMSPRGEIRSNIHIGGSRRRSDYTDVEAKIAELIRPRLIADGLFFVGADIVGDKLLEINVFCPGGINNINELYNINVGEFIIGDLEKRVRIWKTHLRSKDTANLKLIS